MASKIWLIWSAALAVATLTVAASGQRTRAASGQVQALAIFAHFQDEDPGSDAVPGFADDLFNANRPGSLSHFYNEMSHGQFRLDGTFLPRWYQSAGSVSEYVSSSLGQSGNYRRFVREVLTAADDEVDFSRFDNDGPDGVPNSGDDDGLVDFIFINLLSTPTNFLVSAANGLAQLGLSGDFITNDRGLNGSFIRIRRDGHEDGVGGTIQRARSFVEAVGIMSHEYGHVLGLPDLFDKDFTDAGDVLDPELDSAGIGYWGLMAHGARGWGDAGGPVPFCAWSLEQLGWIGVTNEDLVVVSENVRDAIFDDVSNGGKVYKIPAQAADEYFLVEHRRSGNSYYERDLPAGGLLIWHINNTYFGNNDEKAKRVDLVCADGLYGDAGFPLGQRPVAELGRDNLDFWAHDLDYTETFVGNLGDATDVFDGQRFTDFWAASNPSSPAGISVVNIRRQGDDRMLADINVRDRRRAGTLAGEEVWRDTVEVVGDITVAPGGRLTLAAGSTVLFGPDQRQSGLDPQRCEVIVHGQLAAITGRQPVLLSSSSSQPAPGDWYGIIVGSFGQVILGGVELEYAEVGISGDALNRPQVVENSVMRHLGRRGIWLQGIEESVRLTNLQVSQAGSTGVSISGPGLVRVSNSTFTDNGWHGLERRDGFIECSGNQFTDNGIGQQDAANLVLGDRVFGQVTDNTLRGGVGIRCESSSEVRIEGNRLVDQEIGLVSISARPQLVNNEFINTALAVQIRGFQVPSQFQLNIVQGAERLLENTSEREVQVTNNWWGFTEAAEIAVRIEGPADWQPFLNFDPRLPVDFALDQNFPNPFNASTVINYSVGINVAAISGQVEMLLDVRNAVGGLVRRLVQEPAAPGIYSVRWDGRNDLGERVSSGVYFYELNVPPIKVSKRMLLLK